MSVCLTALSCPALHRLIYDWLRRTILYMLNIDKAFFESLYLCVANVNLKSLANLVPFYVYLKPKVTLHFELLNISSNSLSLTKLNIVMSC